jgi:hypothetical protein
MRAAALRDAALPPGGFNRLQPVSALKLRAESERYPANVTR